MKYTLIVFLFILFNLAFLGSPFHSGSIVLLEIWDLGHILLFTLFSYYLFTYWKGLQSKAVMIQFVYVLIIVLVLSVIIETSQQVFDNGTPDLVDIRRNLLGLLLGYSISALKKNSLPGKILFVISLILIGFEAFPLFKHILDK